jgi:hypothetical protein
LTGSVTPQMSATEATDHRGNHADIAGMDVQHIGIRISPIYAGEIPLRQAVEWGIGGQCFFFTIDSAQAE